MSRAFVRERDGDEPPEAPAETPVSEHRNLVTRRGQALLEAELARLERAQADAAADRATLARVARDRRYVLRRLSSAEVVEATQAGAGEPARVAFGSAVTLGLADGRTVTWRIVGEDEADPAHGRIAWVAPVAGRLVGLARGDEVVLPAGPAEVLAVDPTPEPVPDATASDIAGSAP
jgi:transcription elongation GreA/GreB family factor